MQESREPAKVYIAVMLNKGEEDEEHRSVVCAWT